MEKRNNCQICAVSKSKYSCPRCNLAYCSVSCYQSVGHLQCSEIFYEQWVHEELKNCQFDPEAKKKMLETLKQNQEENSEESLDSDDDENIPDLSVRLMDINLDNEEAIWAKLTQEEQQEFKKLLTTGNIIKILPEWEPWWKAKKIKSLIQDCSEHYEWKSKCPKVPSVIPELLKLTKVKPSPKVAFMLLNVLMSYVFTVRWFKGCHEEMPVEGISTSVALSATLRNSKVFENPVESFIAFENDLSKCEWLKGDIYNRDIMIEDLIDIIKGTDEDDVFFCVKAAISELSLLCEQAFLILKDGKTNHLKRFSGPLPEINLLQQISRKMNYYLSWTVDHGISLINIFNDSTLHNYVMR